MKPHAPETVYGVYGLEPGSPSSFETDLHLILILSRIASLHAKHGNRKEHLWRDYASFLGQQPNFSYEFKENVVTEYKLRSSLRLQRGRFAKQEYRNKLI